MSNYCSEEDDCSAVLTGSTCVSNRCVCGDGYKEQNGVCVDTKDNKGNIQKTMKVTYIIHGVYQHFLVHITVSVKYVCRNISCVKPIFEIGI